MLNHVGVLNVGVADSSARRYRPSVPRASTSRHTPVAAGASAADSASELAKKDPRRAMDVDVNRGIVLEAAQKVCFATDVCMWAESARALHAGCFQTNIPRLLMCVCIWFVNGHVLAIVCWLPKGDSVCVHMDPVAKRRIVHATAQEVCTEMSLVRDMEC